MPLAEIARRSLERDLGKAAGGRLQVIQVGRMGRQRVVAVDAVFRQQLPVGTHRVFLRAADDRHLGFGLVADHIEIFLDRAEIIGEALDVPVEADEIEIAIALAAAAPAAYWTCCAP